jgi:hypothetical protein
VRRPKRSETGGRRVHPREGDVAEEFLKAIAEQKGASEMTAIWWDTDAWPTDHREMFLFTSRALTSIRRENPRADIVVNISPGTPAAQSVMLLALQARMAGDDFRALHGTPRARRVPQRDVVHEVPWNLLAELAATATGDDAGMRPAAWSIDHARSQRLRDAGDAVRRVPIPGAHHGRTGHGQDRDRPTPTRWLARADRSARVGMGDFHLNCPEFKGDANMLRSALFGYTKGAHSQALKDEAGLP